MFDEIEVLSEIYDIEKLHYDIIKENIRRDHIIKVSGYDESIIVESFNDITNSVSKLIATLITKISDFFKKSMLMVNSTAKSINKFYNDNKDRLNNLTGVDFYTSGYDFSNLLQLYPNTKPLKRLVDEFNRELAEIPNININTIKMRQHDFLNDGNLNTLRGEILGTNTPIVQNKFNRAVRAAYRNGAFNEIDIHVTDDVFRDYMAQVPVVANRVDGAEIMKREVLDALNQIEIFFDKKIPSIYNGGAKGLVVNKVSLDKGTRFQVTPDAEVFMEDDRDKVEAYMKFKYNQIHEIATITAMVVVEYTNAYKDYLMLLKDIMVRGISQGKRMNIDENRGE